MFKVGDKVRVRPDLTQHMDKYPSIVPDMFKHAKSGRVFTVVSIWGEGNFVTLEKDIWNYCQDWLIPDGPPMSKEDLVIAKIQQLWNRQDYVKATLAI